MKTDAYRFYRAIWDLRESKISADDYRAIMRSLRAKLGDNAFEALKARVIAADVRNCAREGIAR